MLYSCLWLLFNCLILSFAAIPQNPGICNKKFEGNKTVVEDRIGEAKLLICDSDGQEFRWRMVDGVSYGNVFDPAKDCSDIMDRVSEARTGVYWIQTEHGPQKAWCDMETDGGGFMLIGVQDSPITWDVPSYPKLIKPLDTRRWSSSFGNMFIQEFRIQVSISKSFDNTKAHWYYHFHSPRKLTELLLRDSGGCSRLFPGVGNIQYVKDLRSNKIITTNFNCSRFGSHFHKNFGWGKMNQCLGSPCKKGFAHLKLSTTGSFSFSSVSPRSGISDSSTAFVGCDSGKCCVCYGPDSNRDYCGPKCKAINGGTVISNKNKIHTWFWVRSGLPKRLWKKCMEYRKMDKNGKIFLWHVNKETEVPQKGPCAYPGEVRLINGIAVVQDKTKLQALPNIEGLLSYRMDNRDIYFRGKYKWNEIAKEKQINALKKDLIQISKTLKIVEQENEHYASCKDVKKKTGSTKPGSYKIKYPANGFTNVYCHLTSLPGCSGGGWTLTMKISGHKDTFHYSSNYWSNKDVHNVGGGTTGFDEQETKLSTYWTTSFNEICLGMKQGNDLRFISISYKASSLYGIIADGKYRKTSIGRSKWLSLAANADIQRNCNLEGFNVDPVKRGRFTKVRIGILGNQENDCRSPDSFFGFGGVSSFNRVHCSMPKIPNTSGNSAYCRLSGGNIEIRTMGYVLVR
ncbi:uncharacterized protein LOC124451035 [Xenia sp. Carnegie-2017]|uniref:uncharacterized protein LOC124451035 n=1 Tax=Xenia sp. Carnegie-2017 TaxID=2897299 RepID=UPI001F037251|nr:uncharacterized protein LOC124451035 [Xenia sp. Carnegie-2017]